MDRLSKTTFAGVFLLALSVIVLQIALTRVFAIMMWHHLTYMVVSIAMLGFGAAGSLLTARRAAEKGGSPLPAIAVYSAGYGLSVLLALALLRLIEIDCFRLWEDKTNIAMLVALYGITAMPFLFAGLALGLVLTRFVQHVNRLYFTDLVGSGVGGALSVLLLREVGGSSTMVVAATIGLVSALCFGLAAGARTRRVVFPWVGVGLLLCLVTSGAGPSVGLPDWQWHPPFAAGKDFAGHHIDPELDRISSATAEVEVGRSFETVPRLGGDTGYDAIQPIKARLVGQDGTAPTFLMEGAGDLERHAFVTKVQAASAYVALEARGKTDPDVMVIGVGGGVDVMIALLSGAKSVTAVEINTGMIEAATERYDDYIGGLFRPGAHSYSDRIRLVNSEGRSFMRSQPDRYDVIQMSGVDSFTALSTGAYTLSESYLYTVEAVVEFYEHLQEGGIVNYSRFLLAYPRKPRETLRLANIAFTALQGMGIEDPASHIAVLQGRIWASTMIKRGRFTPEEIAGLQAFSKEQGFLGLVFDPLRREGDPIQPAIDFVDLTSVLDNTLDQFVGGLLPEASPEHTALLQEHLRSSYATLIDSGPAAADQRLAELAASYPKEHRDRLSAAGAQILGILKNSSTPSQEWFARTARPFYELLRGDDAERAAFIESYPYDITASTDDTPFFFNYYRYSRLFDAPSEPAPEVESVYNPDFPVGHMFLLLSFLQIVVLAAVMIFWPLRKLARQGVRTVGTWRYFCFFAALGMGFMFVEIVLMQKMVIFLGHPTYAVSVVLASLLAFAGLGSLLAGRIRTLSRRSLTILSLAIAVSVIAITAFVNWWMPSLLGLPLAARIAVVVVALLPVGAVLGMPFPTGMRIVEQNCPHLLPWCWAINGFLSVFSAVFCIILSMFVGFTTVLLAAGAIYVLGFALMPPSTKPA